MGWELPDKDQVKSYIDGIGKYVTRVSEYYEDRKTRLSLQDSFNLLYCELYSLRRIDALEILYKEFAERREFQEKKEIADVLYATEAYEDKVKVKYVYDRVSRVLRDRELIARSTPNELLDKISW